eukprot:36261-Eustigmatos_ZCMA.PRE.1
MVHSRPAVRARRGGKPSCLDYINTPEGLAQVEKAAHNYGTALWHQFHMYGNMVSSLKPYVARYLCQEFNATSVLDPTCGWGGKLL